MTPCPITPCPCKKSLSSFPVGPFSYWKVAVRSLWSLLFSRLNNPNSLSLSSQQRGSSPQIIAGASSGPAPTAPGLPYAEGSSAGCRPPRGVSPEQSRRAEPPCLTCWPCCFWCSPGHGWPSGLPAHIAGSRWASHPPVPPRPSPQGCSLSILLPAWIFARDFSDSCAGPCTWSCTFWKKKKYWSIFAVL